MTTTTITTEEVKKLRDVTGISVMQCKKALEEASGDMNKAMAILKKKSTEIAAKKSEREAKEGLIAVKTTPGKAAVITVNCETDFVARNEDFINLADILVGEVLNHGIEATKQKASELINPVIQKIGENIQLGEIDVIEGENLGTYIHDSKIAVVVSLTGGDPSLAKNIAMQVAAMNPEYLRREDIDEEVKKTATEIFEKEVAEMDKPDEIKKRILQGKIDDYFKDLILLEQQFIKDDKKTIEELLEEAGADVKEFKRYTLV